MEIKYKKLIFNSNAYIDVTTEEVILPISPEWDKLVEWKKEFPKEHQLIIEDAHLQQMNQRNDEEWRVATIVKKGGLSLHTWKYETGEIKTTQEFRGELPHGERVNYYQNGNKMSEELFRMGTKHGEQKFYYDDGGLRGLQYYRSGIKCNVWETYNKDASIQSTIKYNNGIKTYECSYSKHRNPQVIKEINYVDGKMDGRLLDCFVTGKRRTEGKMVNGEMDGQWNFYLNDGNTLELSIDMKAGKIVRVNYKR